MCASDFDYSFSEEDQRKLKAAIDQTYEAIEEGKRLIHEQMDGPSTMLAQFDEVQAELDNVVDRVDELRSSLIQSARLNEALRSERNKAQDSAVLTGMNAYQQAWNDRMEYLTRAMPEAGAKVVRWLSDAYEHNKRVEPEKLAQALAALEALWEAITREAPGEFYP